MVDVCGRAVRMHRRRQSFVVQPPIIAGPRNRAAYERYRCIASRTKASCALNRVQPSQARRCIRSIQRLSADRSSSCIREMTRDASLHDSLRQAPRRIQSVKQRAWKDVPGGLAKVPVSSPNIEPRHGCRGEGLQRRCPSTVRGSLAPHALLHLAEVQAVVEVPVIIFKAFGIEPGVLEDMAAVAAAIETEDAGLELQQVGRQ